MLLRKWTFQKTRRCLGWCLAVMIVAFGMAAMQPAFAGALEDAKAAGYLGERPDGYLGLVNPGAPASVRSLMSSINTKRRGRYGEIAKKNKTDLRAVEVIVGTKLINKAPPGTYVMDASGTWIRK
jgi:uncharacterized protein YdbL (DUF1318 family)